MCLCVWLFSEFLRGTSYDYIWVYGLLYEPVAFGLGIWVLFVDLVDSKRYFYQYLTIFIFLFNFYSDLLVL